MLLYFTTTTFIHIPSVVLLKFICVTETSIHVQKLFSLCVTAPMGSLPLIPIQKFRSSGTQAKNKRGCYQWALSLWVSQSVSALCAKFNSRCPFFHAYRSWFPANHPKSTDDEASLVSSLPVMRRNPAFLGFHARPDPELTACRGAECWRALSVHISCHRGIKFSTARMGNIWPHYYSLLVDPLAGERPRVPAWLTGT